MEDLETLKVIKDKEQSINDKIELIKKEKEKELQQLESTFSMRMKENEERLMLDSAGQLEETKAKAEKKADLLLAESKDKASRMKLKIKDSEIEKLATETFREYLEGM